MIGFCKVHNGAYLRRGRVSRKLAFEAFGRLDLPRNDLLQYQQYGQVFNLKRNVLFITRILHLELSAIMPVANRVVLARARWTSPSIWRVGQRLARPLLSTVSEVHNWRPSQERMAQKYCIKGSLSPVKDGNGLELVIIDISVETAGVLISFFSKKSSMYKGLSLVRSNLAIIFNT